MVRIRIDIVLLGIALVLSLGACSGGDAIVSNADVKDSGISDATPSKAESVNALLDELPQAGMQEELTIGDTVVVVTSLRFMKSIPMGNLGEMTLDDPNLIFMDVLMRVTNLSNNAGDLEGGEDETSIFNLIGGDGEEYGALGRTVDSIVDAGSTKSTFKTFVIHRDAIENARLVVVDLFSDTAGVVLLSQGGAESPDESNANDISSGPCHLVGAFGSLATPEIGGSLDLLAELLAEKLECEVEITSLMLEAYANLFLSGEVDFALVPFDLFYQNRTVNVLPILIPSYGENPAYHRGAFIVRADSGAQGLGDLEGTVFAYTVQGHNYGYHMPRGVLANEGYDLDLFFSDTISVGYSSQDMIMTVIDGRADAGVIWATDETDARIMVENELPNVWDTVETIAFTPWIPSGVIVIRDDLPEGQKEDVINAFLEIIGEDGGQEALYGIEEITALEKPDDRIWEAIDLLILAQELDNGVGAWP